MAAAKKAPSPKKAAPKLTPPPTKPARPDIEVVLSVELGRTRCTLDQLLQFGDRSLFELDKTAGEPVSILLNGELYARGEVVTVSENFGVRITEIVGQSGGDR